MKAVAPNPCSDCPWRTSNHGRRHADGWFTKRNRERLWAGIRRGEHMSCHPSDPMMTSGREDDDVRPCAGAFVLVMREFHAFQHDHTGDAAAYVRAHPRGLTKVGLFRWVERIFFGVGLLPGGPRPYPNRFDDCPEVSR